MSVHKRVRHRLNTPLWTRVVGRGAGRCGGRACRVAGRARVPGRAAAKRTQSEIAPVLSAITAAIAPTTETTHTVTSARVNTRSPRSRRAHT